MRLSELLYTVQRLIDNEGDLEILLWEDARGGYRDFALDTSVDLQNVKFIEIEPVCNN